MEPVASQTIGKFRFTFSNKPRTKAAYACRSYVQKVQAQFSIDKKSGKPILIPGNVEIPNECP